MPDLRKPNFNKKFIPFEKCHNAGNCERGDPLRFFTIHSVATFQKSEGGLFGVFNKKIREKKTKKEKIQWQSHSAENSEKREPLGFLTFVPLQNIKKIERRILWGHLKNFDKKFHKAEKSHSAEKSENFLLLNTCKKIHAYPRVRTRNLWVEKQASYH